MVRVSMVNAACREAHLYILYLARSELARGRNQIPMPKVFSRGPKLLGAQPYEKECRSSSMFRDKEARVSCCILVTPHDPVYLGC